MSNDMVNDLSEPIFKSMPMTNATLKNLNNPKSKNDQRVSDEQDNEKDTQSIPDNPGGGKGQDSRRASSNFPQSVITPVHNTKPE